MARVGQLRAVVCIGSLLLGIVAVGCGDDDDGGDGAGGAADGGAPDSGGSSKGGNVSGGTTNAGTGGGENAGAPSGGGDSPVGGQGSGGAAGSSGAGGGDAGGTSGSSGGGAGGNGTSGDGAGGDGGAGGEPSGVTWLEDCVGIDLSADGTTVLATRGLWRAESGWVSLPDLPGGGTEVVPRALSRDGNVVFGNSSSALGLELTRWKDGVPVALGTLNTPFATNADGSSAIGRTPIEPAPSEGENEIFDVFLWNETGGIELLDSFWDAVDDSTVLNASEMSFFMQQDAAAGAIGLHLGDGSNSATTFRWSGASVSRVSTELRIDALSPSGAVGAFHDWFRLTAPMDIRRFSDFMSLETPECASEPDEGDPKCFHIHQVLTGFDQAGQRGVGREGLIDGKALFFHWQQGQDAQRLVSFLAAQGVTLTLPNDYSAQLAKMSADGHTILGSLSTGTGMTRCFLASY
jgi:hypothetical protein